MVRYAGHMERNEISTHEVAVYRFLQEHADKWVTSREIGEGARVAARTARAHALKLVQLGLLEQAEVFPGHRYQLSSHANQRNRGYVDRLEKAAAVFGLSL
jgi:predicted DNA-binding transcriptional regulator